MLPAERLAALSGRWTTARALIHADGSGAQFLGSTIWTPEGGRMRCVEAGDLHQDGRTFPARRETFWHAFSDGIAVSSSDGRPFHRIGPDQDALHDCPPDTYRLRYDWSAWPAWSVRWRVTGPRKNYRALTRYRRAP
ncbi:DUF6314 family protein [Jannaschia sp. S6380]|uniref:DUF6314 family protein n=1 Tax=Jannaschia sp. S6380 TaxID=2926408 RepID=UPI001FF2795A|nr:DUF6314 family protein [Jannaschia sp. S6380]MCK0166065.1 DUF6314 family protein [Jannaschia sp. S6380]